jgi:hypothetical protein
LFIKIATPPPALLFLSTLHVRLLRVYIFYSLKPGFEWYYRVCVLDTLLRFGDFDCSASIDL